MNAHRLEPGTTLAGKYRLEVPLGEGGMGTVYRAEHLVLKAPVAVKVIDREVTDEDVTRARFMREAQAAASLRSPHVVQILDYGTEGKYPFIVMELLEGETLAERLDRVGRLNPNETYRVISHVARAVGKAHEAGIIHRDLKPDNVFLVHNEGDEIGKVLDFGVAKIDGNTLQGAQTRTGSLLGTPYYMSPEQAQGNKEIDYRSDLWALGVIAFECLTGQRPFSSEGLGDLVIQICIRDIVVPSHVAPVPAGFDAWFAKAVSREPEERFPSARELAEALADAFGIIRDSSGSVPESVWSGELVGGERSRAPGVVSGLLGEDTRIEPNEEGRPTELDPAALSAGSRRGVPSSSPRSAPPPSSPYGAPPPSSPYGAPPPSGSWATLAEAGVTSTLPDLGGASSRNGGHGTPAPGAYGAPSFGTPPPAAVGVGGGGAALVAEVPPSDPFASRRSEWRVVPSTHQRHAVDEELPLSPPFGRTLISVGLLFLALGGGTVWALHKAGIEVPSLISGTRPKSGGVTKRTPAVVLPPIEDGESRSGGKKVAKANPSSTTGTRTSADAPASAPKSPEAERLEAIEREIRKGLFEPAPPSGEGAAPPSEGTPPSPASSGSTPSEEAVPEPSSPSTNRSKDSLVPAENPRLEAPRSESPGTPRPETQRTPGGDTSSSPD